MKAKNIFLLSYGLLLSVLTQAQISETIPQAELNTAPPAQAELVETVAKEKSDKAVPAPFSRKVQYSLSAGSMFSNGFGSAAYVQPSVLFPVTKRFSAFGSLSIVNQFGPAFGRFATDTRSPFQSSLANQRYILNAGGSYAVNDRLSLTGSIWHDLSKQNYIPNAPINLFSGAGGNGMQVRANYKITENLSVWGGFRYGTRQGYNSLYQQGFDPNGF